MNAITPGSLVITATVVALSLGSPTAARAEAQNKETRADLNGQWTLTTAAEGPHGAVSMGMTLKQDGRKITGHLAPPHGGEIALAGEFDGKALKLADASGGGVTMTATLQQDGTLSGYLSSERGDMDWTAVRVKSPSRR
jgi:hypothetical protein